MKLKILGLWQALTHTISFAVQNVSTGLWKNELWKVQKYYLHLQISPIDLDVIYRYKLRLVYFLPHFFSAVYNQERLILKTIYVLNKEIWA
jgi:hypothetical protein